MQSIMLIIDDCDVMMIRQCDWLDCPLSGIYSVFYKFSLIG